MPIVLKSGSLSLLQHSGPTQACNGIALPFLLIMNDAIHPGTMDTSKTRNIQYFMPKEIFTQPWAFEKIKPVGSRARALLGHLHIFCFCLEEGGRFSSGTLVNLCQIRRYHIPQKKLQGHSLGNLKFQRS